MKEIKNLNNSQCILEEKIESLKRIKEEIENKYNIQIKKEEIEFEGEKEKLLKKLKKTRDKFKEEMKEKDNILRKSMTFLFKKNHFNNNSSQNENINPLSTDSKKENEEGFEKTFEFNEEDIEFFNELINEINQIPIKKKNDFFEIKNNWKKKIYEKKNESKKKDAIKKIDSLLSLNVKAYKALEKTKSQLKNNEITVENALNKIHSLEKINAQ